MRLLFFGADNTLGKLCWQQAQLKHYDCKHYDNQQALDQAITDSDACIILYPYKKQKAADRLRSDITKDVVQSMRKHQKERLIILTEAGVGESKLYQSKFNYWFWQKIRPQWLIEEYERQEILLEYSYLQWTVIRPIFRKNQQPQAHYQCGDLLKNTFFDQVSEAAIAHCIIDQLPLERYCKRSITVINA